MKHGKVLVVRIFPRKKFAGVKEVKNEGWFDIDVSGQLLTTAFT